MDRVKITGTSGQDIFQSTSLYEDFITGAGNDWIVAGTHDTVTAGSGKDVISFVGEEIVADGGRGADWFIVNSYGSSRVSGGPGADLFDFTKLHVEDTESFVMNHTMEITDFSLPSDHIRVRRDDIVSYTRADTDGDGARDDVLITIDRTLEKQALHIQHTIKLENMNFRLFRGEADGLFVVDLGETPIDPARITERKFGTSADDIFSGRGASDHFSGRAGNDTIRLKGGDDVGLGGPGQDTITGRAGDDLIKGDTGRDVLRGGAGNDHLDGGAQNDRLSGNGGRDVLLGGDGDDRAAGGAGQDILNGGTGFNRLTGGGNADIFDHDGSAGSLDWVMDFNPLQDSLAFSTAFRLDFSAGDGDSDGTSDDVIITVSATGSSSTIVLIDLDLEVLKTDRPDILGPGFAPAPLIEVFGLDDGPGPGPTEIFGTPGDDPDLRGTPGDDRIFALDGNDVVFAGDGDDIVDVGPGDDDAHGEGGNDTLIGKQGYFDWLFGEEGDDILILSAANTGTGGPGADRFEVPGTAYGAYSPAITDLSLVEGDLVVVSDDVTEVQLQDIGFPGYVQAALTLQVSGVLGPTILLEGADADLLSKDLSLWLRTDSGAVPDLV
ncbi:calcium-binding protein [Pseudodonghicola flavimaris]|uniref:Calcium-binding protein n=1 Tax=Pseudodonghicola flavimaris TaxID=3050036 RepID=A0ABT7F0N4_9RHOB|nr:calcium-binding protein [Pseudodonghicola flavimaris]MDK3018171.1 calcium-binding protein [Pseudodonghicola flavimaris]